MALALLQIVDNPRQDVPLIAALRSPVFGFDGDKLAFPSGGGQRGLLYRGDRSGRAGRSGVPGLPDPAGGAALWRG